MDAVVFMILAIVLTIIEMRKPDSIAEAAKDMQDVNANSKDRVAKLNDNFYQDNDAFSEIIHALGFPKGGS